MIKLASNYDLVKLAKLHGLAEGVVTVNDRMYSFADLGYVQGEFAEAFYQRIKGIKLRRERYDCNKVALSCLAHLSECWAMADVPQEADETALAVGVFSYLQLAANGDPLEGHAAIAVAQPTQGGGELVILEPQIRFGRCLCNLKVSAEEFATCSSLAFL